MDAELLEHARTVDPTVLGQRVRDARLAKGLTQTAVAGDEMSTAYVSRIEAGQRRPDPELIVVLAARLGLDVDDLVIGASRNVIAEQRLALDWAELSLRTGDAASALRQVDDVLAQDPTSDVRRSALHVKAGALEATDALDDAIIVLEDLTADSQHDMSWLLQVTALSRAYRNSGDLSRAIEVGEAALRETIDAGLDTTDESTKLTMNLAAAYFERGDIGHASRLCRRAIITAESHASPAARAAVYWNASIIESRRGHPETAIGLAQKALAILELGDDHLQLSRMRTQLGIMQLRSDRPDLSDALNHLQSAESDMLVNEISMSELASNRVAQARAYLRMRNFVEVERLLGLVADAPVAPLILADAQVLRGQVALACDDRTTAISRYHEAVLTLSGAGADLIAAKIWFELGTLLEQVGDDLGALDAFRRSAASVGVTPMNVPVQMSETASF